jgi:GNAT superfamily N-acetyltransferase
MAGQVTRMTKRELLVLTPDRVADLLGPCAPCTYWQTMPHNGHRECPDPLGLLADWVDEVTRDWGPPGRVAYVDGRPIGHVIIAPARHVPRLAAFAASPSDPSRLMLVTVGIAPGVHEKGLRRALVRTAAKEALQHRERSLTAIGSRLPASGDGRVSAPGHPCIVDVALLERSGFRVEREHPSHPRLRLDLRTALTVRDEAAAYLSRALSRVPGLRPVPETPHPDGATRARVAEGPTERTTTRPDPPKPLGGSSP